jgi:hypothetical protein
VLNVLSRSPPPLQTSGGGGKSVYPATNLTKTLDGHLTFIKMVNYKVLITSQIESQRFMVLSEDVACTSVECQH